MRKVLCDFRQHPQYLTPGAAHRRMGPGQPDELRVDFQMIAPYLVSGHQSARGTLGGGEGRRGAGSPLAQVQLIRTPEFDNCAVSHFCPLLPCATVTMTALSLPDWLCDNNVYLWVSTALT